MLPFQMAVRVNVTLLSCSLFIPYEGPNNALFRVSHLGPPPTVTEYGPALSFQPWEKNKDNPKSFHMIGRHYVKLKDGQVLSMKEFEQLKDFY